MSVLIVVGFVGIFEINNLTGFRLFNLLPTCPNGAIAPNGDVKQCDKTASGEPNYPVCTNTNTHYDRVSGVCVANIVGSLNTTGITGSIPSGPKPSAPLKVHCSDGTNTTDVSMCPAGTHAVVPNSTGIQIPVFDSTNQLPLLVVIIVLLFVLLIVLILKKRHKL